MAMSTCKIEDRSNHHASGVGVLALITQKIGLDFNDTLQYYVAKKLGVDALVSFDEHFKWPRIYSSLNKASKSSLHP